MSFHLLPTVKWLILTVALLRNVLVYFQPHVFCVFCSRQVTVGVCFELQGAEVLLVVWVVHAVLGVEALFAEERLSGEELCVGRVQILRWGGSSSRALKAVQVFFLSFVQC